MIVKQTLFITLLSFYLALLSDSQQILEKKKVVVDIDKSLTKYLVKFYKHRLVEGQNNAISPLLDLYALVLLYKVSDASAKTDLHTLLGIPEGAEDGTMDKFEAKIRLYLEQSGGNSVFGTQLFVDSRIKGVTKELQDKKFFTSSLINFSRKAEFQQKINSWMTSLGVPNKHPFVHNFNFDDKTVSLILEVMAVRWKLPLALSTTSKAFLGEQVKHLEGTLEARYAKIDKLGIQVLEQLPSDSGLKLWLILPNSMVTFINKTVGEDTLNEIAKSLRNKQQYVTISVPQIEIEFNSEENAFLQNNFHVLSSMFSSPSIRLELDKKEKHPIQGFLMHCMFQFVEDNSAKVSQQATLAVNFDKPFTVMALTTDTNIPLLMANYFSVRDKMLTMEDEEQSLAEQVAKEELGNREDL
ncbi:uncharacterized protein LOC120424513 [Culex pipiens pallens]|uniref:uncharacterized protein LOC120424513 n=1 Tax=Culex pipiens pallens TaxID=42434 RepID=UPI00195475AD|nr:uncharacterized protein LOC120424513 [Culex pipiens pallens]XP_039444602.1 uncharacterized protein LOC120424513 [Culex pipiens pallens]